MCLRYLREGVSTSNVIVAWKARCCCGLPWLLVPAVSDYWVVRHDDNLLRLLLRRMLLIGVGG